VLAARRVPLVLKVLLDKRVAQVIPVNEVHSARRVVGHLLPRRTRPESPTKVSEVYQVNKVLEVLEAAAVNQVPRVLKDLQVPPVCEVSQALKVNEAPRVRWVFAATKARLVKLATQVKMALAVWRVLSVNEV